MTNHVLLRNIVLQRCSFFVLFTEKIKNALHIIFYTIFELRPPCKLLSCISPVVQNALICINYAWFQVPVPVSLYRFLVVPKSCGQAIRLILKLFDR